MARWQLGKGDGGKKGASRAEFSRLPEFLVPGEALMLCLSLPM